MLVKELINKLKELPQDSDIYITSMDDVFVCSDFEVHSLIDDACQGIILPYYIKDFTKEDMR